jgi:arsenite-transporting ATPase
METLADGKLTTLILVTRPETAPFKEAARALDELSTLGIHNQMLIINGILTEYSDTLSYSLYEKQQRAMKRIPESLKVLPCYTVPLRAYNVTGLENVRALLEADHVTIRTETLNTIHVPTLSHVIDELTVNGKRVIFTMGKGGVGKTTVAAAVALGLAKRGEKVHLATTDPAAHLKFVLDENCGIAMSHVDEAAELKKYQSEVLDKARASGMSNEDIAYIEEDLRSPCTQEIAVFRAFAEIVDKADDQVVVIDTAPTGHTLLLLESTQSYNHEIQRTKGEIPESVIKLLPRLKSDETEVLIVTLPEATPVYEALRLEEDLKRAGIAARWWIVDQSLYGTKTTNPILKAKAENEVEWLNRINEHADGKFALIAWNAKDIKGERLLSL